jgi:hypothetical protein
MSRGPSLPSPWFTLLERVTAAVLVLVLAALAWMIAVVYLPAWGGWASVETQVLIVLALLSVALVLVSVVALLHTRSSNETIAPASKKVT